MPVVIRGKFEEVRVLAFLDDGSDVSLIDHALAVKIGACRDRVSMSLTGVNQSNLNVRIQRLAAFDIRGFKESKFYSVKNAFTVLDLALPARSLSRSDLEQFSYLRNLNNLQTFSLDAPKLLIGQDNRHLIDTLNIEKGLPSEPAASYTLLGWVVHGVISKSRDSKTCFNSSRNSQNIFDQEIHELVKSYFSLEMLGVSKKPRVIKTDQRAFKLLDETTRFCNGRWETGLLWKTDNPKLPDNYYGALSRLKSIEAKIDKNSEFGEMYYREMDRLFSEGYAVEVRDPDSPPSKNLWYLPHFGVQNPNKPKKLRIVWDAAYRFNGVSLNDSLLSGPDLINCLFSTLLKFRVGKIAIKSDIGDMYMRVLVNLDDQDAQRFLYRGKDRNSQPKICKMTCLLFGSTSSPCSAMYVKNRNAERFISNFPEAAKSTIEDTYVDDYLKSVDSIEEALKLQKDVTFINSQAGFNMKIWSSNCKQLSSSQNQNSSTVNLNSKVEEQALGIQWDTDADCFIFQIRLSRLENLIQKLCGVPTKRDVLRIVMSVYDPCGFISPVSIKAKILLQNVWRRGTGWDERLDKDDYELWEEWLKDLAATKLVKIPRCFFEKSTKVLSLELHVFCDASEKGFAAVAYFRIVYENNLIGVRFVTSKNYVAPLRPLSVPRLELQAAVIGARLAESISTSLSNLKIHSRIFWSDSRVVLCWIRCDPRRYQTYVANRLGEIDELTDPNSWRWVPGELNVADFATKVQKTDLSPQGQWFNGPAFLVLDESQWPEKLEFSQEEFQQKSKVESRKVFNVTSRSKFSAILPEFSRFSRFSRLLSATARVFASKSIWLSRIGKASPRFEPNVDDFSKAKKALLQQAQLDSFPIEFTELSAGREIPKSSRILTLTPGLLNGLLVIQGRASKFSGTEKFCNNPIILDGNHKIARLLIFECHVKLNHGNSQTVINELRQEFWITRLRSALRSVLTKCAMCQKRRGKPSIPRMSELPIGRLTPHVNPFSHCGLDYFGPITITIGRRHEKRYGVLFTCLTMRAVHLEIANSLTTDSAIMAIMRMTARRGQPAVIYSDNGTNLRGASEEFSAAFKNIDQSKLREFGARNFIQWEFNPPSAPHMGGVWESMVKSVKNALKNTLETEHPNEEVLRTLFAEAEHTVNSRPLYYVSSDPADPEAITPNHLLFGASSRNLLPRRYELLERSHKKQWATAQNLADHFWRRWQKEYLPTLICRKKWAVEAQALEVGDVVLIIDDLAPRNIWRKAIVEEIFRAKDGQVRTVRLKTATGFLKRPVVKLIKLQVASESNQRN